MELKTFTQELRALLIEGKTQAALDQLLNFYDNIQGEYYDELIVLASRMRRLRDKSIAGAIDGDDANRQANSINHSLLQIIDDLHNDAPVARHFGLEAPKQRTVSEAKANNDKGKSSLNSIWKTLIGIVVGVVIGFIVIKAFTPAVEETPEGKEEIVETIESKDQVPNTYEPADRKLPKQEPKTPPEKRQPPKEEQQIPPKEESRNAPPVVVPKNELAVEKVGSGENEPNNSLFKGNEIAIGKTIEGILGSTEDADVFIFKTSASNRNVMTIRLVPKSESVRLSLELYNNQRQRLDRKQADNKGADLAYTFSATPNSTYKLKVSNYAGSAGAYQLQVAQERNERYDLIEKENNNSPSNATPIAFNQTIHAFLHSSDDKDYFRLQIPRSGRLTIEYQCLSEQLRGRMHVYDSNNNRVLQNTATGKGANFDQSFSVRKGEYLIEMEVYYSEYGDYSLRVALN